MHTQHKKIIKKKKEEKKEKKKKKKKEKKNKSTIQKVAKIILETIIKYKKIKHQFDLFFIIPGYVRRRNENRLFLIIFIFIHYT